MIILASIFLGAVTGAVRARQLHGTKLDMLHYGTVFAIGLALAGLAFTILLNKII
ncbi:MAG: apolipoprotein acyltransferase [Paracoccaceae bacterium]|nr:apolipoprotein acyltransferase [Paracoccaceae bacterium]